MQSSLSLRCFFCGAYVFIHIFLVLSRLKVNFEDVLIRFEHLFSHKRSGIGLELHIKRSVIIAFGCIRLSHH